MKKRIKNWFIVFLICGILITEESLCCLSVKAEEESTLETGWDWTYTYTGTEQTFTAPYSGLYQFEISGAQGGSKDSNEGGKGGKVTAPVKLLKDEEITIYIGGMDGYNGGGTGTVSNGGGATDIRRNGTDPANRILVAGGGGGANQTYSGGNGGEITSTDADSGNSSGENSAEGAGGGSGYLGGSAGTEHIVMHTHSGYGGSCYAPDYHVHAGNESVYGGCYLIEKSKTVNIEHHWHVTGRGSTFTREDEIAEGEGITFRTLTTYPVEDEHGHTSEITWCSHAEGARADMKYGWEVVQANYGYAGGKLTEEPLNFSFTTSKDTLVTYYDLGCGMTTDFITGYHLNCSKTHEEYNVKQAAGGTNYYDVNHCLSVSSEAGSRTGDGMCGIKLLSLYNLFYDGKEAFNVYYDGIKVKNIYYQGELIYRE